MAGTCAGIAEGFAGDGDELPVVAIGMEGQLEDSERAGFVGFAGGFDFGEGAGVLAASADHEFANAASGVADTIGILWGETLVIVIVAIHYYVGVCFVKGLP